MFKTNSNTFRHAIIKCMVDTLLATDIADILKCSLILIFNHKNILISSIQLYIMIGKLQFFENVIHFKLCSNI